MRRWCGELSRAWEGPSAGWPWGWRAAGTRQRSPAGAVRTAGTPRRPPGCPSPRSPTRACARLPPLDHGVPNLRLGATQSLESLKVGLLFFLSPAVPALRPVRPRPRGAGALRGVRAGPAAGRAGVCPVRPAPGAPEARGGLVRRAGCGRRGGARAREVGGLARAPPRTPRPRSRLRPRGARPGAGLCPPLRGLPPENAVLAPPAGVWAEVGSFLLSPALLL